MSKSLDMLKIRSNGSQIPKDYSTDIEGIMGMGKRLSVNGGLTQQERMIRDKRKTLNEAVLYSYQAAQVQRIKDESPIRALINPNKLKMDYDDKIISIGYEFGYKPGDVFEWCNTHSHWIIYLQDLTELAYFRGDIRKCSYEISWKNSKGEQKNTYIALRGPVETRINSIQKHKTVIDNPNYSLHMLVSKNEDTLEYFQRYNKFYLKDSPTCWRVEAVDTFSTPGIIEVNAVEYYANETEDDIENGIVGGLVEEIKDPNEGKENLIIGETFIKPKQESFYYTERITPGQSWFISNNKLPVKISTFIDKNKKEGVLIQWTSSYSGQFDLCYGKKDNNIKKTIVVESLF